ncbi:hypothetical protein MLD38_021004 [Melastoma candidum]|uniref:Uncharacterized protein n=1 Tax=Melastoma candidum TaxID=119954 RepID=A0ACB9QET9_9MYRT|nr:hypothetical protein MLD38_021004 [Melastoma candidum]
MSTPLAEIIIVPKIGQGHLFPCIELCKHLLRLRLNVTLFSPFDDISSSLPSSLLDSPHFCLTPASSSGHQGGQINQLLEDLLADLRPPPACAIVDHIMYRTQDVFSRLGIPSITFITSGACWAAVQHAAWAVSPNDMQPGEARSLPGLPDGMVLTYSDLQQRRHWMPAGARTGGRHIGPPLPGQPAPWVEEVKASSALLINTCDDLEGPFLEYVEKLTSKPVWGVGPLLPSQYWQASAELLKHGREVRPERESNYSDDEVVGWLDKQGQGSVVYVSFGSEVGPAAEEYPELALALEESKRPFIWVIQKKELHSQVPGRGPAPPGGEYFPVGLDDRVGQRGLVIHGWAPQLLILSHPSTGIFVSHCGWNSTVEAIVRGVPFLAWPIRGDQYYNAKLVVDYLKSGVIVSEGYPAESVKKDDIVKGVEKVLTDKDVRRRSLELKEKFEKGFPESSSASIIAFTDFITSIRRGD